MCVLNFMLITTCGCWQEEPAVIKSYYDKRIVGCPGGEGGKPIYVLSFCYLFLYYTNVVFFCMHLESVTI